MSSNEGGLSASDQEKPAPSALKRTILASDERNDETQPAKRLSADSDHPTASKKSLPAPQPSTVVLRTMSRQKVHKPEIECVELSSDDDVDGTDKKESDSEDLDQETRNRNMGGRTLLKCGDVTVAFEHMSGLWPEKYVNDSVVDAYLQTVFGELTDSKRNKMHVFSTFLWRKLVEGVNHNVHFGAGVKKALSRFSLVETNFNRGRMYRKVDLFSKDYLIFPVVDDFHWFLVIIVKPWKAIVPDAQATENKETSLLKGSSRPNPDTYAIVLDSMIGEYRQLRPSFVDVLRDYLELEFAAKKATFGYKGTFERTRIEKLIPETPQQPNFTDCALYLACFAENFMRNTPGDKYLRPGQDWMNLYPDLLDEFPVMRQVICEKFRSMADPALWKEFSSYNEQAKAEDMILQRYASMYD